MVESTGGLMSQLSFHNRKRDAFLKHLHDMQQKGVDCDLTLATTGEDGTGTEIPVHRVVLRCMSQFFRVLFESERSDATAPRIHLPLLDPQTLALIVNHFYGAVIEIDEDNVRDVLVAAEYLLLDELTQACARFLASSLCVASAFECLELGRRHCLPTLRNTARTYIRQNAPELMEAGAHLQIPGAALAGILADDSLRVPESTIYELVITWIEYDVEGRRSELASLLHSVRWGLLPSEFLTDTVCKEPLVISDLESRQYMNDVLASLSLPALSPLTESASAVDPLSLSSLLPALPTYSRNERTLFTWKVGSRNWATLPKMPDLRHRFGAAAACGVVFLSGGWDVEGGDRLASHYLLDLHGEGGWRRAADLPTTVYAPCMVAMDRKAYLLGGARDGVVKDGYISRHETTTGNVLIYDVHANTWVEGPSMLTARGEFGSATVCEGVLYATGTHQNSSAVEMWDPRTPDWLALPSMPTERYSCSLLGLDDCVVAMLGSGEGRSRSSIYDVRAGLWRETEQSLPVSSFRESATVCDGRIVVAGGSARHDGGVVTVDDVWINKGGVWSAGPSLSVSRSGHRLISTDQVVLSLGGNLYGFTREPQFIDLVEAICVDQ